MLGIKYDSWLHSKLKDPEFAAGFLCECLKEGEGTFLVGLRDVTAAQGGFSKLSRSTKLNREGLYSMFSKQGNPTLSSLIEVLRALGLEISFQVTKLKSKKVKR